MDAFLTRKGLWLDAEGRYGKVTCQSDAYPSESIDYVLEYRALVRFFFSLPGAVV